MAQQEEIRITATRFADFVVTDGLGQLARVREIQRQFDDGYSQGTDYWKRLRDGIERLHRVGAGRDELESALRGVPAARLENYRLALEGYRKSWGRKSIQLIDTPRPRPWRANGLTVRVNPEWTLSIDGVPTVVKLHMKRDLQLTQRLADPLLHLLATTFRLKDDDPAVAIVDVHRGKVWRQTRTPRDIDAVLNMHAAAFVTAWRELRARRAA